MGVQFQIGVTDKTSQEPVLTFGDFSLRTRARVLMRGRDTVQLGSRALEILSLLVERAGELVTYRELVARAWPTLSVDESNLRVQIAALRKVLVQNGADQHLIVNIAHQGYMFSGQVVASIGSNGLARAPRVLGNLPATLGHVVGRDDFISEIGDKLGQDRLVTVVGAGGIGKTTVALKAAAGYGAAFAWFVDLGPVTDPALVPVSVARTLGVSTKFHEATERLINFLRQRPSLLVLDNCEHLLEGAANLVDTLLASVTDLKVLATSREPLKLRGEALCRLRPLDLPPPEPIDLEHAFGFPAVKLFVERARAHTGAFELVEADAPLLVEICRRLDGIPLALEVAAGAAGMLGLQAVARGIEGHFDGFGGGRRTALPRQQTLRATLDWSVDLLSEDERRCLLRLSVFSGIFSQETITAICISRFSEADVISILADLADKSLVVADTQGDAVVYRLLETTRAYAYEKFAASEDFMPMRESLARHMAGLFARAQADWSHQTATAWAERFRPHIGDVRQSLAWAFGPGGDKDLGAQLLVDSAKLWLELGFLAEFLEHALGVRGAQLQTPALHERLSTIVRRALNELDASDATTSKIREAFDAASRRATLLGDKDYEFDILIGQSQAQSAIGDYAALDDVAKRVLSVGRALGRPDAQLYYLRIMALSGQLLGALPQAEDYVARAYEDPQIARGLLAGDGFTSDPMLFIQSLDARLRWSRGAFDQALSLVASVLEDAATLGHLPTYNYVLRTLSPIAVWAGDPAFINGPLERFLRAGEDRNLAYRSAWRTFLHWGVRARVEGWSVQSARMVLARSGLTCGNSVRELLATFHPGFLTDEMLGKALDGRLGWCAAEMLRAAGVGHESQGQYAQAELRYRAALALARQQGALAWELRAAVSLYDLMVRQGGGQAEHSTLAEIYGRFTEGFGAEDMIGAASRLRARKDARSWPCRLGLEPRAAAQL
jgi:predicted ATPase/DNA-binding winged helix-turn-helix (wHTH) protein